MANTRNRAKSLKPATISFNGYKYALMPARSEVRYLPDAGHKGGDVFVSLATKPSDADGSIVFDALDRPLLFVMKWADGEWTSQTINGPAEPGVYRAGGSLFGGRTRIEAIGRGLSIVHRRG